MPEAVRNRYVIITLLSIACNFITVYLLNFHFSVFVFICCSQPQQSLIKTCSVFPGARGEKMWFWQFQKYQSFFWINPQFFNIGDIGCVSILPWLADSVCTTPSHLNIGATLILIFQHQYIVEPSGRKSKAWNRGSPVVIQGLWTSLQKFT